MNTQLNLKSSLPGQQSKPNLARARDNLGSVRLAFGLQLVWLATKVMNRVTVGYSLQLARSRLWAKLGQIRTYQFTAGKEVVQHADVFKHGFNITRPQRLRDWRERNNSGNLRLNEHVKFDRLLA